MVQFTRVLCPVDLSEPSLHALRYASAVARWYAAKLDVLHVVPTFEPLQVRAGALGDPVQMIHPMPREEVVTRLRRALSAAGLETRGVGVRAEAGDTVATIVDQTLATAADLVVIGTHGHSGVDRLLLGSVTERVLRKVPCPVLTVPPHAPEAPGEDPVFTRLLCGMDFSPSALLALGFALDLARRGPGSLTVLHVVEWLADEEATTLPHLDLWQFRDRLLEDARNRLRALMAGESATGCEISEVVAAGRAYREILRHADAGRCDLIVMGAQGRGGAGRMLFGSATEQVVRAAACPVLTVRG